MTEDLVDGVANATYHPKYDCVACARQVNAMH